MITNLHTLDGHVAALIAAGYEVHLGARDGQAEAFIVKDSDTALAHGKTHAEALWAASPLVDDADPFPAACPAVSADGDHCTVEGPGYHQFHYGPDKGNGVRRMWDDGIGLPAPGIEADVRQLDAEMTDVLARLATLEDARDAHDQAEGKLVDVIVVLAENLDPEIMARLRARRAG